MVDLAFATWRRSAVQALARYQRVRVPDASEALWLGSRGEMPFLGALAGTTPFRKSHPCDSLGRCSRKDRKLAVGTRSAGLPKWRAFKAEDVRRVVTGMRVW